MVCFDECFTQLVEDKLLTSYYRQFFRGVNLKVSAHHRKIYCVPVGIHDVQQVEAIKVEAA